MIPAKMNKGQFNKEISRIIKKYPCRTSIIGKDREFILSACSAASRYSKLAGEEGVVLKAGWHTISNGRKVKMLFLHRNGGSFSVPISKTALVEANHPTKRKVTETSLEKKHKSAVLAAMRNMVSYQLSNYRKSVKYPLTCWRSGKRLIRGMKMDVDHVGAPFLQLADIFLSERDLRYTDVILSGPVNNKQFKDKTMVKEWKSFHKEKATLAMVLASENRSAGAGDYTSPEELLGSFKTDGGIGLDF